MTQRQKTLVRLVANAMMHSGESNGYRYSNVEPIGAYLQAKLDSVWPDAAFDWLYNKGCELYNLTCEESGK